MRFKKRSYSRMKENRINCDQFMEAKIDVNRNKNGHLVFEPFDIDSSLIFDGKDSTKFHSNQLLIVHNDSGEINRRSFRNRSSSNESNRFCLLNSLRSAAIYSQSTIVLILIIVFFINSLHYSEAKNFQSQETAVLSPSIKCNKTLADQNVRWLYFFDDPDRKAPFDHKSFQEFCDQTNQKELSVKDYAKKCLAKFPRQITSLLMFGIIRKNKQLCSKTKLRNEMIHASNCLNAMKTKGSRCFNRAIQDLLIVKHMQLKDRVGRLCCVYFQLEECVVQQAYETPGSCNPKDAAMIENLIEGYTSQVVSSTCQNYPKSHDNCDKLLPKREMNKLKKLITNELSRTYSLLPPLIDILDSIPP